MVRRIGLISHGNYRQNNTLINCIYVYVTKMISVQYMVRVRVLFTGSADYASDCLDMQGSGTGKKRDQPSLHAFFGKRLGSQNRKPLNSLSQTPKREPSFEVKNRPTWWHQPKENPTKRQKQEDSESSSRLRLWDGTARPLVRPQGAASAKRQVSNSTPDIIYAMLTDEQKHVLDLVLSGQSIFFTGAAGTGKSYLLRRVVENLAMRHRKDEVAVTATTGLASFNIEGMTIHRWGGLGLARGSPEQIAKNITANRKDALLRWKRCKVLVIDEISMLDGDLFDKLEEIARRVRNSPQAFGGIQVVLTGDFFQLPPVSKEGPSKLCFESQKWQSVVSKNIVLSKVFRQKDVRLIDMLNAMRHGRLTPPVIAQFKALAREVKYTDGLEPTQLFPLRSQVEAANRNRMSALGGRTFTFSAQDTPNWESTAKYFEQLLAPKQLDLKVGAQVLLIWNIDETLVNGRRGTVISFAPEETGETLAKIFREIPRVQQLYNMMLDRQGVTSESEKIIAELGLNKGQIDILYLSLHSKTPKYPIVDFTRGLIVLVPPKDFTVGLPAGGGPPIPARGGQGGKLEGQRHQVPLVLSWALSIHKAQGQTLDRVKVDLSGTFERGQAYVAVSRASSYDRLQITGFDPSRVKVDEKVKGFYGSLGH